MVTYDRRGMSDSPAGDPMPPLTPGTHADDLALLLKSLADGPALIFGTSLGAQVGLHLLARHPQLVDTLVAHEPSEFLFLTEEERAQAAQVVLTAYETYKKEGFGAAMSRWAAFNDIDYGNLEFEPGAQLSPMTDEQLANIDFFITHEMPAYSTVQLDEAGLDVVRAEKDRLVAGHGHRLRAQLVLPVHARSRRPDRRPGRGVPRRARRTQDPPHGLRGPPARGPAGQGALNADTTARGRGRDHRVAPLPRTRRGGERASNLNIIKGVVIKRQVRVERPLRG